MKKIQNETDNEYLFRMYLSDKHHMEKAMSFNEYKTFVLKPIIVNAKTDLRSKDEIMNELIQIGV